MQFDYVFWAGGYGIPMRPQGVVHAARRWGFDARFVGERPGAGKGFGIAGEHYTSDIDDAAVVCIGGGEVGFLRDLPEGRPVVADYNDCWARRLPPLAEVYAERKDSTVLAWSISPATTRELESFGVPTERIRLVPNAFHPKLLSVPAAALMGDKQRHIVVFGTMGDWTDPEVLVELANRLPQFWLFVFTNFDPPQRLTAVRNVHIYRQTHPFAFLPLVAGARCTLIPFIHDDFAIGSDPIKYYESVAMNTPVVASNVESLVGQPGVKVVFSRDRSAIVDYFEQAILESNGRAFESEEELDSWRSSNHWVARLAPFLQEVKEQWAHL